VGKARCYRELVRADPAWLLELARLNSSQRILDLGTGCGEPPLTAARVVGPDGHVHGVDLSRAMLDVARRRAHKRSNVGFAEGNINALDRTGRFDVVQSRLGLIFMADRASTLRILVDMLAQGGVSAAAVWGPPSVHRMFQALSPLLASLEPSPLPPESPNPFSMSDSKQIEADLAVAGFPGVSVSELSVPVHFRSFDQFVRFNLENLRPVILQAIHDRFGSEKARHAWRPVRDATQPHLTSAGSFSLPCVCLHVRAVA